MANKSILSSYQRPLSWCSQRSITEEPATSLVHKDDRQRNLQSLRAATAPRQVVPDCLRTVPTSGYHYHKLLKYPLRIGDLCPAAENWSYNSPTFDTNHFWKCWRHVKTFFWWTWIRLETKNLYESSFTWTWHSYRIKDCPRPWCTHAELYFTGSGVVLDC